MKKNKKPLLSLKAKESFSARLFLIPFYIGFFLFSFKPFIETFIMIFNDVKIKFGGYAMEYVGIDNLKYVYTEDPSFLTNLFTSVGNTLWQVPSILFVSLFLAVLLNGDFKGRGLARGVFFLPVIVVTGTIMTIIQRDVVANAALNGGVVSGGTIEYEVGIDQLLIASGLNAKIVTFFTTLANNMFNLLWRSGIQIVLFLAGLQNIPSSLYEASSIEGATKVDDFFKITLPMTLPIMLINTIFTIVDGFTDVNNQAMKQVLVSVNNLKYGIGAAMSWTYFLIIGVFIVIVMILFSKLTKKFS